MMKYESRLNVLITLVTLFAVHGFATQKIEIKGHISEVTAVSYTALRSYRRSLRSTTDVVIDGKQFVQLSFKITCSNWNKKRQWVTYKKEDIVLIGSEGTSIKSFADISITSYEKYTPQLQIMRPKLWPEVDESERRFYLLFIVPANEKKVELRFADQHVEVMIPAPKPLLARLNKPTVKIDSVTQTDTVQLSDNLGGYSVLPNYTPISGKFLVMETTLTFNNNSSFESKTYSVNSFSFDLAYHCSGKEESTHCVASKRKGKNYINVGTSFKSGEPQKITLYFPCPTSIDDFKLYLYGEELGSFSRP